MIDFFILFVFVFVNFALKVFFFVFHLLSVNADIFIKFFESPSFSNKS